jgi:ABC-type lipoprotein release transport system permease subunit
MKGMAGDAGVSLGTLRWSAGAVASAAIALSLGMAAAIAALELARAAALWPLRLTPVLGLRPVAFVSWLPSWSPFLRVPARIQADGVSDLLGIVLALAALVFAIGAAEAGIGLVARAYARRSEIALRAAVGASRRRLTRQCVLEGAMLGVAVAAMGAGLGSAGARVLLSSWPGIVGGGSGVGIALAVVLASGLFLVALSLWPILGTFGRGWIMDRLAAASHSVSPARADGHRVLVILQLATALTLLSGAGLVFRQSPRARTEGSAPAALEPVVVSLDAAGASPAARARIYGHVAQSVASQSGRSHVAVASPGAAIGVGPMDRVLAECGRCVVGEMVLPVWSVFTQIDAVGPGFFDTLGVPLLRGREFNPGDDAREVIVNQTMVDRGFLGRDPIGKRIQIGGWGGGWYRIIGVVRDVPRGGIGRDGGPRAGVGAPPVETRAVPAVYLSALVHPPATVDLLVRGAGPPPSATRKLSAVLSGLSVRVGNARTLAAAIGEANAPVRWFGTVAELFACLALLLAIQAVYGLMRFTVVLRRGEIGVRRAVGATRGAIGAMILRETVGIVLRGTALGLVGSVMLAGVLRTRLADVPDLDPTVTLIAVGVLAGAALLGALLPARAAARLDPADAIARE